MTHIRQIWLISLVVLSLATSLDGGHKSLSIELFEEIDDSLDCVVWEKWPDRQSDLELDVLEDAFSWTAGDNIFIGGGCRRSSTLDDCSSSFIQRINMKSKLVKREPVLHGFTSVGAASAAGDEYARVYVFGGVREHFVFSSELTALGTTSTGSLRWETLETTGDLPKPVKDATLVRHNGKLILFGGFSDDLFSDETYILDIKHLHWKRMNSETKPSARKGHSAGVFEGSMYVFGGTDGLKSLNDLWKLDLTSLNWRKIEQLGDKPSPRERHTATFVGSRMVIYGGCAVENTHCFSDYFVFDSDLSKWVNSDPSPRNRRYDPLPVRSHVAGFLNNTGVMFVGGCSMSHECSTEISVLDIDGPCEFSCVNGDFRKDKCICDVGWAGRFCDEESEGCPNDCSGHGRCNGVCQCDSSWTGNDCSEVACPNDCSDSGICDSGKCECFTGFGKDDCSVQCGGNGHLEINKDGKRSCMCNSGFSGALCETSVCPNNCNGRDHGICDEGTCYCKAGFTDDDCGVSVTCSDHGSFIHGSCECNEGWGSRDCSKELQCFPGCSVHGHCVMKGGESVCECDDGFEGATCSEKSCGSNCSEHGVCRSGHCECFSGYFGSDCKVKVDCPGNCTGSHGTCTREGTCKCKSGWGGESCTDMLCPDGCSGNGECAEGVCSCNHGFSGPACDETCKNHCSGHGVCWDMRCHCAPGFKGDDCSIEKRCKHDCHGNGECFPADGTCSCKPGFSGPTCNIGPECPENCNGRGECFLGKCQCRPGFGGDGCTVKEMCPFDCGEHGVCFSGECVCKPGWKGKQCKDEITCPDDCSNQGICLQGTCICEPGFGDDKCSSIVVETDICPNDCSNQGVCHFGRCFCAPGFAGVDCAIATPDSCPSGCSEHGTCFLGKCKCSPGFYGPSCSKQKVCSEKCFKNGICAMGKCFCVPGYEGEDCTEKISSENTLKLVESDMLDYASKTSACVNDCSGHGICVSGTCKCLTGYEGDSCADPSSAVLPSRCPDNCSGRGRCYFNRCFCDPSFSGESCELEQTLSCPNNCGGHGLCSYGKCFCDPGHSGKACEDVSIGPVSLIEMPPSATLTRESLLNLCESQRGNFVFGLSVSHIILTLLAFGSGFLFARMIWVSQKSLQLRDVLTRQ